MPSTASAANSYAGGDPRVQRLSPERVQQLLDCSKTPRVVELETYQAYYEGKAYEGRPHFFDDETPLQKRAPNVTYRMAFIAAESNVAFAMGEGRFPIILSLSSENDDVFDKALGLNASDSAIMDSFNSKLIDLARLEPVFRHAYRMSQASRSVAIVLGYRSGLPFADLVWAKLCTPTFGDPNDPYRCTRLEVRYRYTEKWRDALVTGGEWWTRVFEYLRVIDDKTDTVYQPVPIWDVTDAGAVEKQTPIKVQTKHGFGLCPVHWYARNRESIVGGSFDGKAVHDGLCGMIEQLDFSISQRHRAAIYAGDPQTVLSGVDAGDVIGNTGDTAVPTPMPGDLTKAGRQWGKAFTGQTNSGQALRRGVGEVWRIADASGKAVMLTLPGDALKALDDDAKDLANKLCDDMGVTLIDPAAVAGAGDLSGRTLAFLFSKQINRVSQDREDLARCCILPVLNLFYRMLLARSDGVYLPGLPKVLPILKRFNKSAAAVGNATPGDGQTFWFCPQLKLKWGDYFEPSDVDEATRVSTAIAALTAPTPMITLKSAVEHVRGVFQIGSVDQYVDALKAEADEREAKLHDAMAAMTGGTDGSDDSGNQKPSGSSGAAPGPGSSSAPAGPRPARAPRPPRSRAPAT